MNLADRMPAQRARAEPAATDDAAAAHELPSLGEVVARIAAEVAGPLTAALDRVLTLARSGQIDRGSLQSLRDEIDGARRVGLRGQQIARFASGRVQAGTERINLSRLLRDILTDQAAHAATRSAGSRQTLAAAEVEGDASLVHAVLQAAVDWSTSLARAGVEWRLDIKPWPVRARVQCRFAHGAVDLTAAPLGGSAPAPAAAGRLEQLDTLDWLLLQYTAHMAGVIAQRGDGPSHTTLVLEFIHTVQDTLEGASAVELDADGEAAPLMAGSQVLVLAARREARAQVHATMHGHDLIIDHVSSVAEACRYCEDDVPEVMLFESSFDGDALRALCAQLRAVLPGLVLLEIVPGWQGCEMGDAAGERVTRIGADGLRQMLPSVMLLEMARRH